MTASLVHFLNVVNRIQQNSWWSENFGKGPQSLKGFTYSFADEESKITHVPTEPFESLLLHVRKLTMNDAPENMLKIRKALKSATDNENLQRVLDSWHKYWRIAFIKESFECENGGIKELMTPYRVYDCFINGQLFHSNDPKYNVVLHGAKEPLALDDPDLFLRNIFHSAVANFCLAAMGLKWFIESMNSPNGFMMIGYPPVVFEYVLYRNQMKELDEQYKVFSDSLEASGGCPHGRWGS